MKETTENPSAPKDRHTDCLNTIRLLAALQVFTWHTCTHLQIELPGFIWGILSFFPGVPIFFLLSGYLIWQSVERQPTYFSYLGRRFKRLYPELWIAVALEIAVMCILYQEPIPLYDLIRFAVTQGTFLQFWTPDSMRGYGYGTPNGSLWTITVLVQFYIIAWFFYKIFHRKKNTVWVCGFGLSLLCAGLINCLDGILPELLIKLIHQTLPCYFWMFFLGAFAAEKRDVLIPFLRKYWYGFFLAALVYKSLPWSFYALNYDVFDTFLVFSCWLGFAYRYPVLNIRRDISYGIYIYHMIAVNALIALGFTGRADSYLIVLVITCLLAYLSNLFVGKIFSKQRRRLLNK